jgi:hypothetical protein
VPSIISSPCPVVSRSRAVLAPSLRVHFARLFRLPATVNAVGVAPCQNGWRSAGVVISLCGRELSKSLPPARCAQSQSRLARRKQRSDSGRHRTVPLRQYRTAPYGAVRCRTAPDGTVRYRTAPHGTADVNFMVSSVDLCKTVENGDR